MRWRYEGVGQGCMDAFKPAGRSTYIGESPGWFFDEGCPWENICLMHWKTAKKPNHIYFGKDLSQQKSDLPANLKIWGGTVGDSTTMARCFQLHPCLNTTFQIMWLLCKIYLSLKKIFVVVFQLNSWMPLCLKALWITDINFRHL